MWILIACGVVVALGYWFLVGGKDGRSGPKVSKIDPASILFSIPTLNDALPPTVQGSGDGNSSAFRLDEDDWRQIEFIAAPALPRVQNEMVEIEAFKRANQAGLGWKNVYLRKERPDGLFHSHISYASLIDSVPHGPIRELMIGMRGQERKVEGGFAFDLSPTVVLYGRQSNGILVDLAVNRAPEPNDTDSVRIPVLCKKFDLILANWYACRVVSTP